MRAGQQSQFHPLGHHMVTYSKRPTNTEHTKFHLIPITYLTWLKIFEPFVSFAKFNHLDDLHIWCSILLT